MELVFIGAADLTLTFINYDRLRACSTFANTEEKVVFKLSIDVIPPQYSFMLTTLRYLGLGQHHTFTHIRIVI